MIYHNKFITYGNAWHFLFRTGLITFLFLISVYANAAVCQLTEAKWDNDSAILTGQTRDLIVKGNNCSGTSFSVNLMESDGDPNTDERIVVINGKFSDASLVTLSHTFTLSDYQKGGEEASDESVYFEAVAGTSKVLSSAVSFKVSAAPQENSQKIPFKLNPPSGVPTTLGELAENIGGFILNISIPIAVILIIVAGVMMLTSAGNSARVTKAKSILWYTILGLAIILIGKGFITLVISILGITQ